MGVRLVVEKAAEHWRRLFSEHGKGTGKIVESLRSNGLRRPSPSHHAAIDGRVPEGTVAILQHAVIGGPSFRCRQFRFITEVRVEHVHDMKEFVAEKGQ